MNSVATIRDAKPSPSTEAYRVAAPQTHSNTSTIERIHLIDIQTDHSINCYLAFIYLLTYICEWTKVFTIFTATISRVVEFRGRVCTVKRIDNSQRSVQFQTIKAVAENSSNQKRQNCRDIQVEKRTKKKYD